MKLFPHYSDVLFIVGEGKTEHRKRAIWYGMTQGLLNLPRLIIMNTLVGLRLMLVGILAGLFRILALGIFIPFMITLTLFLAGLAGKVTLKSDEESEKLKTAKIKPFGA